MTLVVVLYSGAVLIEAFLLIPHVTTFGDKNSYILSLNIVGAPFKLHVSLYHSLYALNFIIPVGPPKFVRIGLVVL